MAYSSLQPPVGESRQLSGQWTLAHYLQGVSATMRRTLLENIRVYAWSSFGLRVLNGLFTVAIAYLLYNTLFKGQTLASFQAYTGSKDYLTFAVIGSAILIYANGALLGVGRSLITERRMGTIEALFLSPTSHSAYLIGVLLQQMLLATVDVVMVFLIGIFFGADFSRINWPAFLVTLIIGYVGFLGMGVILSAAMLYLRDTYLTQNTVLSVLFLLCGVLFPIQYLPFWAQWISNVLPLTATLQLARNSAMLGMSIGQQLGSLGVLLGLSLVYCLFGLFFMQKVRRIALEESLS